MAFYQPTLFPEPEQDPKPKRAFRFTEEQRQEMCRFYQAGQSLNQVATAFDCSLTTVLGNLRRRGVKIRSKSEGMRIKGHHHSEETRRKIGAKSKGRKANLGNKYTPETRRKMSEKAKARGESHNFRVDGKGDERRKERKSSMSQLEYRLWREAVFQRDNYTCQECGRHGGLLRADHIKPWHDYPELRFDVSNGRTLCDPCHKKTPTYGGRLLRKKQE